MIALESPLVAVIVLNWNGGSDTVECLQSLLASRYPSFRIYVVDNGSTDGSLDVIRKFASGNFRIRSPFVPDDLRGGPFALIEYPIETDSASLRKRLSETTAAGLPSIVLLRSSVNLGFAQGNNEGLRVAQAVDNPDYALILNNDTAVSPDTIGELVRAGQSDPRIGVVGARILYYERDGRRDLVQFAGGVVDLDRFPGYFALRRPVDASPRSDGYFDCQWVSGTAMLVRLASITVPFLDPIFFFGCEDVDFSLRMSARGHRVVLASRAIVRHKGGVSRRKRFSAHRLQQFTDGLRTNLLFLRMHGRPGSFWAMRHASQAVTGRLREAVRNLRNGHRDS